MQQRCEEAVGEEVIRAAAYGGSAHSPGKCSGVGAVVGAAVEQMLPPGSGDIGDQCVGRDRRPQTEDDLVTRREERRDLVGRDVLVVTRGGPGGGLSASGGG